MKDLLKVKTIITLMSFTVFCYLAIIGKIEAKDFMIVLMAIVTYYFNKDQKEVKENEYLG